MSLAKWTAPLLLAAVACAQLTFAKVGNLSPWKGGGFGMFSTLDSPSHRDLRFYVETEAGDRIAEAPVWLQRRNRSLRVFPARWILEHNALRLAQTEWMSDSNGNARLVRDGETPTPDQRIRPMAVRIEVWRKRYVQDEVAVRIEKFVEARAGVTP